SYNMIPFQGFSANHVLSQKGCSLPTILLRPFRATKNKYLYCLKGRCPFLRYIALSGLLKTIISSKKRLQYEPLSSTTPFYKK
ncbi:MAG: hypothetical protein ACRDE2_17905, partial [Chitinophagaceae bacterium]